MKYVSVKPLLFLGLALAAIIVLITRAQFHGTGTPAWFWAVPGILLCAVLALLGLLMLAMKHLRAGVTFLGAVLVVFSAVCLTFTTIRLAEGLRLEKLRAGYIAQIDKLPVIDGQRVQAFPWSDERSFGPVYLLYDEADTLYRTVLPTPIAWTAQAEKTLIAEGCVVSVVKLDVRYIADHFYAVGCQDQYD